MHSRSNDIELTSCNDTNGTIVELFKSLRSRHKGNLEISMKESVLFSIQFNWCKCHKVNFKRGGLFIDSPDWVNKKKATINPKKYMW